METHYSCGSSGKLSKPSCLKRAFTATVLQFDFGFPSFFDRFCAEFMSSAWASVNSAITRNVMVFVDGTNTFIAMGESLDVALNSEKPTLMTIQQTLNRDFQLDAGARNYYVRKYWFGSMKGSNEVLDKYRDIIRD